jgi:RNA-dependent RNA polymerase
MPRELCPRQWPHFMEKRHRKEAYHSEKVLGQLYDIVQLVKFVPDYESPFDTRILEAHELDAGILQQATELKDEYDTRMKRIMAQHEIETEFEVWSSFVMSHNQDKSDYTFAEELGKILLAIKDHFRKLCKDKVEGSDPNALARLVAAMYTVTAREVEAAVAECKQTKMVAGEEVPIRTLDPKTMPLISFPWIFDRELGKIANGTFISRENTMAKQCIQKQNKPKTRPVPPMLNEGNAIRIETDAGPVTEGEVFKIFEEGTEVSHLQSYGVEEVHVDLGDNESTPLALLGQLVGIGDFSESDEE